MGLQHSTNPMPNDTLSVSKSHRHLILTRFIEHRELAGKLKSRNLAFQTIILGWTK